MHRDAELPSTRGQSLRDAGAADGDEAQAFGARRSRASSCATRPESNCGTRTAVVGCTASNAPSKSAGLPAPTFSATAEAKCVRAPTKTGTQMAVMVSSSKAERQERQIKIGRTRADRLAKSASLPVDLLDAEAHALWSAGAAGRIDDHAGTLAGAGDISARRWEIAVIPMPSVAAVPSASLVAITWVMPASRSTCSS